MPSPPKDADHQGINVAGLAGSLVRLTRRLAQTLPSIVDDAVRDELSQSLDGVREVTRSLRNIDVLYDPEHARHFARQATGLEQLAGDMAGLVDEVSRTNEDIADRLASHVAELEQIAEASDADAAARLQATVERARGMATDVNARLDAITVRAASAGRHVASLHRELADARDRALVDALTRLHSRLALFERLEAAVRAGEAGGPWCLALVGVDDLDTVIEAHGPIVGDAALYRVARSIEDSLPDGDGQPFLARYGADEFALLLAGRALADARGVAETLRAGVAATRWQLRDRPELGVVRVAVSIGLAAFRPGDTASALVARAEDALRRARDAGGNTVVTA